MYRLGIDLGTNSIGWCALKLDGDGHPCGLLDAGVRLITTNQEAGRDPQSKTSLAVERRLARSTRRRRDRFLRRQKRLMTLLIRSGLMPSDEAERKALEKCDPYGLRAAALDGPINAHHLGRALFHINQRRGFKSNRIADSDNDDGATKAGIRALKDALEAQNARTLGEFLARRHERRETVRFRPQIQGAKALYDYYPHRDLVDEEIDEIWNRQKAHHACLTDDLLADIKRCIIAQRPLRPAVVGKCGFRPEEERAPRALPLFQRFRILQDLSSLMIDRPQRPSRKLTRQERDYLLQVLLKASSTVTFEKLRAGLKLPDDARFNYEASGHRKGFEGDQTAAKLGSSKAFGKAWRQFPLSKQTDIVERLLSEEDEDALIEWLESTCDLTPDKIEAITRLRLPQGHSMVGRTMLRDLVDVFENEAPADPSTGEILDASMTYDQAVKHLGLHHSDRRPGERLAKLPYYGRVLQRHVVDNPEAEKGSQEHIGKVTNPTVHIALNQMGKLVNALIDAYGPPAEIVIELARELKWNQKRKEEYKRELASNTKANEARVKKLKELGVADNGENRLRMRLYEEMPSDARLCVYSGETISCKMLFDGRVEIDHILPFSKSLDDGIGNKVLCLREANREKGGRAPADAFSAERAADIEARAELLFKHKAWRFKPDALTKFDDQGGWQARHLTDTQHMARLTKEYLGHICDPDQVWAVPGRMTSMLRGLWGLNSVLPGHNRPEKDAKDRDDHRHHAIDAFVIACTDRRLLQRIARASGDVEHLDGARLFGKDGVPKPWEAYREALAARLETMVVAHKADHGKQGQLHEDTAYGLVNEEIDGKAFNLVTRKPIDALTEKEAAQIRDEDLRGAVAQVIEDAKSKGLKLNEALKAFGEKQSPPIRRVRILKTEQQVVKIEHGDGFEKAYIPGPNHRVDIFECADGSWSGEAVTVFDANQPDHKPKWRGAFPDARLVMTVHKGDLIELEHNGQRTIMRAFRLEPSAKRIRLAPHNEAGVLDARHKDKDDPFTWLFASYSILKKAKARRVRVDLLGRPKALDRPS